MATLIARRRVPIADKWTTFAYEDESDDHWNNTS
jgi:hypothetical protein